jgi:hypothetical protein
MGEYDAVSASQRFAVLAKQIAGLRKQREEDRKEIEQLREMVSGLAATVKSTLGVGKAKAPATPRWDNLDQAAEAAQLAQLGKWVNGVLRVQYPGYPLPGCWPGHREALWELGTLHAEWQRTYAGPRGVDLDRAEWFHERWLPGVLSRLNKAICTDGSYCRTHGLGLRDQQKAAGW